GDGGRRNQLALAVEGVTHHAVDALDHPLAEGLELAGHAGRGTARGDGEANDEHHDRQEAEDDAVEVEGEEVVTLMGLIDREGGQVMLDVLGQATGFAALDCHSITPSSCLPSRTRNRTARRPIRRAAAAASTSRTRTPLRSRSDTTATSALR